MAILGICYKQEVNKKLTSGFFMFYNIHTHSPQAQNDIVCVENIHENFNADVSGRQVTMGLHPWFLKADTWEKTLEELCQNAGKPEVLAVGECGLDKLTDTDWNLQIKAFQAQIQLAREVNKPLIIHCVRAFAEVLKELRNVRVPVVFHGVNNKQTLLQPVIDAGYYLSFGRALINAQPFLIETMNATPSERILLETDDGEIDIREVYKSAARIKDISEKEIVLQLEKNFLNVFGA